MTRDEIMSELVIVENQLNDVNKQVKELEKQKEVLVAEIMADMESNNLEKLENLEIRITYVAPQIRKTLDVEKLKVEYSIDEISEECYKETKVKPRVNIKLK